MPHARSALTRSLRALAGVASTIGLAFTNSLLVPATSSALVGTAVALAAPSIEAAETRGVEEHAVRLLVSGFAAHWKDGKKTGTLRMFTEDAVLIPPNGHPPVEGTDAIRDYWWPADAPERKVTRYEIEPVEVVIELDLAYVRARYDLEYKLGEADQSSETIASHGSWLAIIKRGRDLYWKISRLMWDEALPGTAASSSAAGK